MSCHCSWEYPPGVLSGLAAVGSASCAVHVPEAEQCVAQCHRVPEVRGCVGDDVPLERDVRRIHLGVRRRRRPVREVHDRDRERNPGVDAAVGTGRVTDDDPLDQVFVDGGIVGERALLYGDDRAALRVAEYDESVGLGVGRCVGVSEGGVEIHDALVDRVLPGQRLQPAVDGPGRLGREHRDRGIADVRRPGGTA